VAAAQFGKELPMPILSEELPLHFAKMDTSSGMWLIAVANVRETQSGQNLLLKLRLEQSVDDEIFGSRELSVMAPAAVILEAETCAQVIDRIRDWIEKTEGNGFLDLVRN
jgi:hypothetical protein